MSTFQALAQPAKEAFLRPKPSFRGVLHHYAALVASGAGAVLVLLAPSPRATLAASIYAASLVLVFTVSAAYHRPMWPQRTRAFLRRVDHAAIFLLIAGTYTPVCLLAMPQESGSELLWLAWGGAAVGVVRGALWPRAPRFVTSGLYVALGWMVVLYFEKVLAALSARDLGLIAVGGAFYTLGAVVYGLRWPNPAPKTFGYHEVFHAMTIVAAVAHFVMVMHLVQGYR